VKKRLAIVTLVLSGLGVLATASPAGAVKPPQGSFETGTCTTTTGHGSNAVTTTDPGNCGSANNPNVGIDCSGWNTGHGFVPKECREQ
jgi:hypothetical protein